MAQILCMTNSGWSKRERREEEGFGDSEQDVVGSAAILPGPIREWSHYGMYVNGCMISVSST